MANPRLMFLVSQPRSGSTMLQHILAAHPQVATLPESWFMLPIVYMRQPGGHRGEYNADFSRLALDGFLENLASGQECYQQAVREFAMRLYGKALQTKSGATLFLDKTPRYFFILKELREIFPDAIFVLLIRNPIAVLASIINYNFGGDVLKMLQQGDRRHDLLTAPKRIFEAATQSKVNTTTVKYEALVVDPDREINHLCEEVGLEFEPEMLNYSSKNMFENSSFVDKKSVYKHENAVTDYVDSWTHTLSRHNGRECALAYLDCLEDDLLAFYGENRESLRQDILGAGKGSVSKFRTNALRLALLHGYHSLGLAQRFLLDWKGIFKRRAVRHNPVSLARRILHAMSGRPDA